MSKFLRVGACAGLMAALVTIAAGTASVAAGAAPAHVAPRLIDTDRVVGNPLQNLATVSGPGQPGVVQAQPGGLGAGLRFAPTITLQPVNDTVAAGSIASFSAAASSSPAPSVRWQVSTNGSTFASIPGSNSTTYSFTASAAQNGSLYRAEFLNPGGSATTTAAQLTVTPAAVAPTVTLQPVNDTVVAGSTASYSAAASGSPTPTVQWQVSTDGTTFSAIAGATSTTYSFTASAAQNGYSYQAVFTNSSGSATTSAAGLTVTSPVGPAITLQPVNDTVAAGTTASFSATASGSPAPSVQWQVSTNGATFSAIAGATATTYSFTASAAQNGYSYQAVFTNTGGSATTSVAGLTVTPALSRSSNWSGYVNSGTTFKTVSASWTVPKVICPNQSATYSAQWIGIDGDSSSTVEQDGTEADCLNGSPTYDAWYEMYGDNAVNHGNEVEISPTTNPVSPGDVVSASVNVVGTSWTLALSDTSTSHAGWTFSTTLTYSGGAKSSAEWVVERPEICGRTCSLTTLSDFGSVTFTNAATTTVAGSGGSISSNASAGIEMVNGSTVDALPGPLSQSGASFTDTWEAG